MIGLEIEVGNATNNYLYKIFNGVDVTKYIWYIVTDDIMFDNDTEQARSFFGEPIVSGENFLKSISRDSYYMIFVDVKAFPVNSKHIEINTYQEYLNSECQMIFLCADSSFIDFYCKDLEMLKKVYDNCVNHSFEKVEVITEENNSRTRMSVL
jgi:hypothetical protein